VKFRNRSRLTSQDRRNLSHRLTERVHRVGHRLDLLFRELVVGDELVALLGGVEQALDSAELVLDLLGELCIAAGDDRLEKVEALPGTVQVGLEVPQVGTRPVLLLAGDLAAGDLLEQALRAFDDVGVGDLQVFALLLDRLGVGEQLVGQLGLLRVGQRRVVLGARWPQILFEAVPAGPVLALGETCLAGVDRWVEIAELGGDRTRRRSSRRAPNVCARSGRWPAPRRRCRP
jgi:hypothetical protein